MTRKKKPHKFRRPGPRWVKRLIDRYIEQHVRLHYGDYLQRLMNIAQAKIDVPIYFRYAQGSSFDSSSFSEEHHPIQDVFASAEHAALWPEFDEIPKAYQHTRKTERDYPELVEICRVTGVIDHEFNMHWGELRPTVPPKKAKA